MIPSRRAQFSISERIAPPPALPPRPPLPLEADVEHVNCAVGVENPWSAEPDARFARDLREGIFIVSLSMGIGGTILAAFYALALMLM